MIFPKKHLLFLCVLFIGGFLILPEVQAIPVPTARLTLQSTPGDFVGQGGNFDITYTPNNSNQFSSFIFGLNPIQPTDLLFAFGTVTGGSDNTFATLWFSTKNLGLPMQTGVFPNAERAPLESLGHPGLSISFQNRGCNQLSGNFTVTDVSFASDPLSMGLVLNTFAASFQQNCETFMPPLFGTFEYNAFLDNGGSEPIPEPSTMLLLGSGMVGLIGYRMRKAGA